MGRRSLRLGGQADAEKKTCANHSAKYAGAAQVAGSPILRSRRQLERETEAAYGISQKPTSLPVTGQCAGVFSDSIDQEPFRALA